MQKKLTANLLKQRRKQKDGHGSMFTMMAQSTILNLKVILNLRMLTLAMMKTKLYYMTLAYMQNQVKKLHLLEQQVQEKLQLQI
jgi:hypothetical protein